MSTGSALVLSALAGPLRGHLWNCLWNLLSPARERHGRSCWSPRLWGDYCGARSSGGTGSSSGSVVAGWFYDHLHHYEQAFWLCAGAFLLAALGLLLTAQPQQEHAHLVQASAYWQEEVTESREA